MTDPRSGNCPPFLLVTGSSGLVGSQLVRELSLDHFVIGLDDRAPPKHIPGTIWLECNFADDQSVRKAFHKVANSYGKEIVSVLHLAEYRDFSGERDPRYQELNVNGTIRLLDALTDFNVEQLIFASSLWVMKPVSKGERIKEDSPRQAEWAYPESKLQAEQMLRGARGKFPVIVARLAVVYDDDCHSVPLARQIKWLYDNNPKSWFYPGNPDLGQSFVHLDDVADFFKRAVLERHDLVPWEAFLVGEPDVISYGDLLDLISQELHDEPHTTIRIPQAMAKAGAWVEEKLSSDEDFTEPWMLDLAGAHYPLDITKARRQLGWEPQHRLRITVPVMIAHLKADPVAWHETNGFPVPEGLKEEQPVT